MTEDEDLRIKALREELMREIESAKNDVGERLSGIESNIRVLKWLFMALIAVFGLIATILASAANII